MVKRNVNFNPGPAALPLDVLKIVQEDVKEVRTGLDCGVALEGFSDFKEGDIIEFYVKERVS